MFGKEFGVLYKTEKNGYSVFMETINLSKKAESG